MKGASREIKALSGALEDVVATSIVELCQSTSRSIELNRAAKLRVWKDFNQSPCINSIHVDKYSAKDKQLIVDKYYQL
ncbi:hypothetical protein MFRU_009g02970 [Monilinia fructicola]|nr:hypothetical protein MFRU_009g02970 [Monilinia fructicola]